MIAQVNGFRYGEISRKQAGRYAEDGYQQGCFQFKNAMTMYDTGMTRRYPLRPAIQCEDTEIYTIHPFRISDTDNYLLGFGRDIKTTTETDSEGKTTTKTEQQNCIVVYGWRDGSFQEIQRIHDGSSPMFAIDDNGALKAAALSEEVCRGMRFAQYYTRMYVVSHEFRTMYIEKSGDTLSAQIPDFVFNKDSMNTVYFIKSDTASSGKVLFKKDNKYYEDINFTTEHVQATGETYEVANNSYVSAYNDYEAGNEELNYVAGTYPSVVAIINDSLYLANTKDKPSAIWKSRTIGSSQWIGNDEAYSADSMHDFTQFQVVATEETKLKDSDEWPQTAETGYYETENAQETWYVPNTNYGTKLKREQQYWLANGRDCNWFKDSNMSERYTWNDSSGQPTAKYDKNGIIHYYVGSTETELWCTSQREVYPFPTSFSISSIMATDYKWTKPDGSAYVPFNNEATNPVKKPLYDYDLTNADKLYETETTVDFVTTDSCGVRMELNTGANDEVRFITAGCGKIIVGISTCEKTLPADFSAVSNLYSSHYSDYGSLAIEPIKLGRSFFFFQTGRKIRELYLSDGYMEDADVTALNHDIFDDEVVDTVGKNTPDPSLYSVLANGEIVQVTYDRNGGLNSFARWDNPYFEFKSVACMRRNDKETLYALVKREGKYYICYFYEPNDMEMGENIYIDKLFEGDDGSYQYTTFVETVYAEVYDGANTFGRFKKAKTMYIRPYHCGHIMVGNDTRQLNKTNVSLKDTDYTINVSGTMEKNFSMKLQSVESEPMTILAIAWEA